eukprot:65724-Chlamydomonas_euryale.AAC.1
MSSTLARGTARGTARVSRDGRVKGSEEKAEGTWEEEARQMATVGRRERERGGKDGSRMNLHCRDRACT